MEHQKNNFKIAITASGLRKSYRENNSNKMIHALDGLSIQVREGEILGILGPNGAGKTTFLNTLATLLTPDSGKINILGIDVHEGNFKRIRSLINMSSGYPNYPWVMTVEENLLFYGRLYGLMGQKLLDKVNEVMALFELHHFAKRRFDQLSSGTKQRLSLAKALLNDPKVIFLDEPTIGLDPDVALKTRKVVLDVLKKRNVTVLLTSHNMDEVESMCDRVAFIKQGKIIKLSTIDELKKFHQTDDLEDIFIQLAGKGSNKASYQQDLTNAKQTMAQEIKVSLPQKISCWFSRSYAFTMRNALFAVRNLFVMTDVFFWPLISLVSIGLMTKFVNLDAQAASFIITGTIAAGILQIVQLDVGYAVLYELWSKSLKHTLLTPVGIVDGLWGAWVMGIVRGSIVFIFLSIAASLWFGFTIPNIGATLLAVLGLFLCALLLGMLVNVLILSFGQKVEITAWMFAHLFMIVCGIYYPVNVLPQWGQMIAAMIPITYFLEYMRLPYGFDPVFGNNALIKGFGLTVFYYICFIFLLKKAYIHARNKGTIIRMSE